MIGANNFLIILPFYNKKNWTADYQVQTASYLAQKYPLVAFCEYKKIRFKDIISLKRSPRKLLQKENNYYLFNPADLIPFQRFEIVQKINSFLNTMILFLLLGKNPFTTRFIIWGFHPEVADFSRNFPFKHLSIYDCVDYFDSLIGEHKKIIKRQETFIKKNFDLMVVNSRTLYHIHKKDKKDIEIVPLGFVSPSQKFKKTKSIKGDKPVIGYVGAINYRLDFKLLRQLVEKNKQWTFVFWGPRQVDIQDSLVDVDKEVNYLFSLPNVVIGQSNNREDVYAVIKQFDICIIPYNVKFDFNRYCFPLKLFEYFYAGKPVLSSPINELKYYPKFVKLANTIPDWEKSIKESLEKPWPREYQSAQKKIALDATWDKKINSIWQFMSQKKL